MNVHVLQFKQIWVRPLHRPTVLSLKKDDDEEEEERKKK